MAVPTTTTNDQKVLAIQRSGGILGRMRGDKVVLFLDDLPRDVSGAVNFRVARKLLATLVASDTSAPHPFGKPRVTGLSAEAAANSRLYQYAKELIDPHPATLAIRRPLTSVTVEASMRGLGKRWELRSVEFPGAVADPVLTWKAVPSPSLL